MVDAGYVLLLSAQPEAHARFVDRLRASGLRVRAPRTARDTRRSLERPANVVLVDLVHGATLDRAMVESINSRRGHTLVVALHEGEFGSLDGPLAGLSVDGFCRAGNWEPIASASLRNHTSFALH